MSASRDRVSQLASALVEEAGYDLEDVQVTPAGRRRLVRVIVDRDDGVSLDDAAHISRMLSEALDEEGTMGETAYVLEVTSPGTDRPLTLPRHWRRAATRLVKVTRSGGDSLTGRVVHVDDDAVTLDIAGIEQRIAYTAISRAVVQIEFNRSDDLAEDALQVQEADTSSSFDDSADNEQDN